jgi:hypothetical protein
MGLFKRTQGPARENQGRRVDSKQTDGLFNKITARTVSGMLSR